ncbi:MAG: PAS domain S-box protein [Candidatus Nitrospinota bacterium M3_3B_026]
MKALNSMTSRHILALGLVALLSIVSYAALRSAIDERKTDAVVINTSGRQRMLSLKIAYLSGRLASDRDAGEREKLAAELEQVVRLMKGARRGLVEGDPSVGLPGRMSPETLSMYFEPPYNVDGKVRAYLSLAEDVLEQRNSITPDDPLLKEIDSAVLPLVNALDAVTERYEEESAARIERLDDMERIVLALTLVTLAAIAVFIFRPMVRRETEKLLKSQKQLAAVLEMVGEGVITAEADGRIAGVNRKALETWGYAEEELLGESLTVLMPERYRARHEEGMRRHMETGERRILGKTVELAGLRKNGEEFPLDLNITQTTVEGRTLFIGAARDITERKEAERELEKYRHHLEELVEERANELNSVNRELEAFSYSVSHDLRAPLRGVDGFSQALLEDYGDRIDEQGKFYLTRVRAGCQRMGELIDGLLNLSRLTRGVMEREDVNLSEMAHAVIDDLRRHDPGRAVDVVIDDGLVASGDRILLRAVLDNLLSNAWKFTEGREGARIEFGADRLDGETVYHVRDNGAGFDMRYAGKLFGAFQRLHGANEYSGAGIGLATVQRVIRRHGGRVWGEGEVGKGSTFYFTLS